MPVVMTLAAVNALDRTSFIAAFGDVAEHSPWVAEAAFAAAPFASREALFEAFATALKAAPRDMQHALICMHPDLAGKASLAGDLAAASRKEQAGAGLDQLTAEEFARFTDLNTRYRAAFGFPFIFAVKGATKDMILEAFERRLENDAETEFRTALGQIERIFRFRLEERVLEEQNDG